MPQTTQIAMPGVVALPKMMEAGNVLSCTSGAGHLFPCGGEIPHVARDSETRG